MNDLTESQACTRRCWYIGGGLGIGVALLLLWLSSWSTFASVFAGIVVAVAAAILLQEILCSGKASDASVAPARSDAVAAPEPASAPAAASAAMSTSTTSASAAVSDAGNTRVAPTTLMGAVPPDSVEAAPDQEPSNKTAAKSAGGGATASAPVADDAAAKPATAGKSAAKANAAPAAKKAAAKKADPAPKSAPAAKAPAAAKAKPARKPVAADGKPEMLTKARDGGADDLKLISGVGPKLEQTLNELGVYHFDQVASWRKKEIEWVDSRLRFKGRIERDGWIAQAKTLAKGGETEFSKRKKKA